MSGPNAAASVAICVGFAAFGSGDLGMALTGRQSCGVNFPTDADHRRWILDEKVTDWPGVVIDTETTGVSVQTDRVVELGAIFCCAAASSIHAKCGSIRR